VPAAPRWLDFRCPRSPPHSQPSKSRFVPVTPIW
jgi:hypothetical protein